MAADCEPPHRSRAVHRRRRQRLARARCVGQRANGRACRQQGSRRVVAAPMRGSRCRRFGILHEGLTSAARLSPERLVRRVESLRPPWTASFGAEVEFPFPALIVADLHVVMCRAPCPVTCAPCSAARCLGSRTPALPAARQKRGRISRRPRRVVHASASTTCSTSPSSFHQVMLPVGLLDPHVQLAQLPG